MAASIAYSGRSFERIIKGRDLHTFHPRVQSDIVSFFLDKLAKCFLCLVVLQAAGAWATPASRTLPAAEPLAFEKAVPKAPKLPVRLRLYNSGYAYNGENDAWNATRVTLTYFENLFEPTLVVDLNAELSFKVGAGLLIPFDQEQKISRYYPVVQTKIKRDTWSFELGSLDGNHNFPAPILDPLSSLVPQIRLGGVNQIPVVGETFPSGRHSHGRYEYGLALKWFDLGFAGELYFNWQLPDTTNHRERFDIGVIHNASEAAIPWYVGVHYWHNGGHENVHPIEITENYTLGVGLKNAEYTALYLASYFIPDRSAIGTSVFGQALYFAYRLLWGGWTIQPQLFVSDELRTAGNRFVSVEGDPFFRVPLYIGLNISKDWQIVDALNLKLSFVNGFYQTDRSRFNPSILRFDQMVRADFVYDIDL